MVGSRCAQAVSFLGHPALEHQLVAIPDMRGSERYSSVVDRCGSAVPMGGKLLFSRVGFAPPGRNYVPAVWGTLVRASVPFRQFHSDGYIHYSNGSIHYGRAELTVAHSRHLSHNAAFACINGELIGYGGRDRRPMKMRRGRQTDEDGIYLLQHSARRDEGWRLPAFTSKRLLAGNHSGCVERRDGLLGTCEFDGRLSVVQLAPRGHAGPGSVLLYARANTKSQGGARFVQVTQSADGKGGWTPFRLIRFACGRPSPSGGIVFEQGFTIHEIYFFLAHTRANGGGLVGLFPATFTLAGVRSGGVLPRGGVFVAFSRDGLLWSPPVQIMRSRVTADPTLNVARPQYRTSDYPVHWEEDVDGAVIQIEHGVKLYGMKVEDAQANANDRETPSASRTMPYHCRYRLQVPPQSVAWSARDMGTCLPSTGQLLP